MASKKNPFVAQSGNDNAGERVLAPIPLIDRYPTLLGSNLTLQYLSAVYRLCQSGYRQQYVDALDELIEKDPHAFAIVSQRVLAVAGGRVDIVAAKTPEGDADAAQRAAYIRDVVQQRWDEIPKKTKAFYGLLWGVFYGITALETYWTRDVDGWHVAGFGFIHSRRLAYPDQGRWDLRIWDQGMVQPGLGMAEQPTMNVFGLSVADHPGKFIVFEPGVRGNYTTREGVGREIAWYMAIKNMAMRGASQFVERFSKPWALAYYNTKIPNNPNPRVATQPDIDAADLALKALGSGALAGATLPDSIKVELDGPAMKGSSGGMNHAELIRLCNDEMSKAVLGGTLTTDAGDRGARSLGEVHERGSIRNARYDAANFADTIKTDLIWWLTHLNFPGEEHLCPNIIVHVEHVSPEALLKRAIDAAGIGLPVDGAWLAGELGLRLVNPKDEESIRVAPLKPAELMLLEALHGRSGETDFQSLAVALAEAVGLNITPAMKSALARMTESDVAGFMAGLIAKFAKPVPPTTPVDVGAPAPAATGAPIGEGERSKQNEDVGEEGGKAVPASPPAKTRKGAKPPKDEDLP